VQKLRDGPGRGDDLQDSTMRTGSGSITFSVDVTMGREDPAQHCRDDIIAGSSRPLSAIRYPQARKPASPRHAPPTRTPAHSRLRHTFTELSEPCIALCPELWRLYRLAKESLKSVDITLRVAESFH